MSLQKAERAGSFSSYMATPVVKQKVADVIGEKRGQAFITHIVSAVSNNPALMACEHATLFSAGLTGESLNLAPSPQLGYYYIVPFKEKDKRGNITRVVATFQLGYRGYIQLALRSGKYADLDVIEVREGEFLGRDKYTGKFLFSFIADEEKREKLPVVGYMAYFELLNGFRKTIYWSREKMEKHAETYSQSYRYDKKSNRADSFWSKDFNAMAFKTMLRQLLSKWGVMSLELQEGFTKDQSADINGKTIYVDNAEEKELTAGLEDIPIDYGNIELDNESNQQGLKFEEPTLIKEGNK